MWVSWEFWEPYIRKITLWSAIIINGGLFLLVLINTIKFPQEYIDYHFNYEAGGWSYLTPENYFTSNIYSLCVTFLGFMVTIIGRNLIFSVIGLLTPFVIGAFLYDDNNPEFMEFFKEIVIPAFGVTFPMPQ